MQASQRWGVAGVLAVAIGAIAFVTFHYDRAVALAAIPLVVALAVVLVRPAIAPAVVIAAGALGLFIVTGYMVWAGMHGDQIADPHGATRAVQTTMAVCGLALMTGRAIADRLPRRSGKPAT